MGMKMKERDWMVGNWAGKREGLGWNDRERMGKTVRRRACVQG